MFRVVNGTRRFMTSTWVASCRRAGGHDGNTLLDTKSDEQTFSRGTINGIEHGVERSAENFLGRAPPGLSGGGIRARSRRLS